MSPLDGDDLINRFTYHPPKPGQPETYERIRNLGYTYAKALTQLCPPSRELSLAVTRIEEAVFWANAAIARHGDSPAVGVTPEKGGL